MSITGGFLTDLDLSNNNLYFTINNDVFNRNLYLFKVHDESPLSKLECVNECLAVARHYSTLCAGIGYKHAAKL